MIKEGQKLLRDIRKGNFVISHHARKRMAQRMITYEDIVSIARTCDEQSWQQDRATFRFMGYLVDGERGGVVATYRDGVLIVTVLDRRAGR